MKLDQDGSDQILAAVRTFLPDGVTAHRRCSGNLIIKYKSARFEWHSWSSPAFGHLSGRNARGGALAIAYRATLRDVTRFLTGAQLRWPGLTPGPVDVDVTVDHGVVHAALTDADGQTLTFPALHTSIEDDRPSTIDAPQARAEPESSDPKIESTVIPDLIAARIVAAVTAAMPADFTIKRLRRSVRFRSGGQVLVSDRTVRAASRPQPFAPRNRDGVTQRSIGWATWMLLDGLLRMSRSGGAPIDKATAGRLQAYTQVRDGQLYCWLAEPGDGVATVTFAPIDLTDLAPEPPKGPRLPIPLINRYRLPELGEVMTAPGNQ